MPTQHKRVSVTLTPPLQDARERLRRLGLAPSVGDLALAGALAMLANADRQEQRRAAEALLRKRLASRLRGGVAFDVDALAEVRDSGWTRS